MHRKEATIPELPSLEPGVQRLATDGDTTGAVHTLVADHALREGGPVYWLDGGNMAATRPLASVAGERVLRRIQVARAFQAFQQTALVRDACAELPADATLVVATALDRHYRADDCWDDEGRAMLEASLDRLESLADEREVPVLLTRRQGGDALAAMVDERVERTITCTATAQGPRFSSEDFETLVYPCSNGLVQTTIAFWAEVLAARQPLYAETAGPAVAPGASGGGEHIAVAPDEPVPSEVSHGTH